MDATDLNAVQGIVAIGEKIASAKQAGNMSYVLVPDGHTIKDVTTEANAEKPLHRRKGTIQLRDARSFIDYFQRFEDPDSIIFADPKALAFTAILDYHQTPASGDMPRHGEHRAIYALLKSPEWEIWGGSNAKQMGQVDFAQFIEDNAADIVEPDPAAMIEVARDLSAKSDVTFASSIRLENGQTQFVYQEEIRGSVGKGNMQVPSQFTLAIPLFFNGSVYRVMARLRYRIREGKLAMWYELYRVQNLVDVAFREVIAAVEAETETRVLLGQA